MIDVLNIARDRFQHIFHIQERFIHLPPVRAIVSFNQSYTSETERCGFKRLFLSHQSETKIKQHVWRVNQTSGAQIDLIENNTLNFSVLT